jgi:hypothetical protein
MESYWDKLQHSCGNLDSATSRRLFLLSSAAAGTALLLPAVDGGCSPATAQEPTAVADEAVVDLFRAIADLTIQIVTQVDTPGVLEKQLGIEHLEEEDERFFRSRLGAALALAGEIPRHVLIEDPDLDRLERRTFAIAREIEERFLRINPSLPDPLLHQFPVNITFLGVVNPLLLAWWIKLLILILIAVLLIILRIFIRTLDFAKLRRQVTDKLVDLAGGPISEDALGSTVQEVIELVRRELDEDQEKRLCEATLEDLQREFEREQNRRRRQRLRRILDELRQLWTRPS